MAKTSSISIRLEPEQYADVQLLAKKFRTNDVQIVRWAIDALREYVDLRKGKLHMPIDFQEFWQLVEKTTPIERKAMNTRDMKPEPVPRKKGNA